MKKICLFALSVTLVCSCSDIEFKTKQDWGFINAETEEIFQKGLQFAAEGKNEESILEFKKALEIEPKNALLLCEMGTSYKMLNKFPEAEEYYNKVLATTPVYPIVYPNMANLMVIKREYLNAIKYGKAGLENCEEELQKAECAINISAGYVNLDSCNLAQKYFELTKKLRKDSLTPFDQKVKKHIYEKCQIH